MNTFQAISASSVKFTLLFRFGDGVWLLFTSLIFDDALMSLALVMLLMRRSNF